MIEPRAVCIYIYIYIYIYIRETPDERTSGSIYERVLDCRGTSGESAERLICEGIVLSHYMIITMMDDRYQDLISTYRPRCPRLLGLYIRVCIYLYIYI
jgi:hypothetical protein